MYLVQMILYEKFKYWLMRVKGGDYVWTGIRNNASEFEDQERAEAVGLVYSNVEFTIEKIFEK